MMYIQRRGSDAEMWMAKVATATERKKSANKIRISDQGSTRFTCSHLRPFERNDV